MLGMTPVASAPVASAQTASASTPSSGMPDASQFSPSRIAVFDGGIRVVVFS